MILQGQKSFCVNGGLKEYRDYQDHSTVKIIIIMSNPKIENTQMNNKRKIFVDRDETINDMISESSKLAQKEYKTMHNWVGKEIIDFICILLYRGKEKIHSEIELIIY